MTKTKPLTRTEMKILIYNKIRRGMTYDEAVKQLSEELNKIKTGGKNGKNERRKRRC